MKKVYLVHGGEGNPNNHWFPWLKKSLEENGFEVYALEMPNPNNPNLNEWVNKLNDSVNNPDEKTYFIGHSLGCVAVLKYIVILPENTKIGGCVFVACFASFGDEEIRDFNLKKSDLEKIKKVCEKFVNIFSDDDRFVSINKSKEFADLLNAKKIIETGKGHFTTDDKIFKLPSVLNGLLEIAKK